MTARAAIWHNAMARTKSVKKAKKVCSIIDNESKIKADKKTEDLMLILSRSLPTHRRAILERVSWGCVWRVSGGVAKPSFFCLPLISGIKIYGV